MEWILILIAFTIIMYFIFVKRTRKLYKAIEILDKKGDNNIIISQSIENIINTVQAQFKDIQTNNDEIFFKYKNNNYKIAPLNKKEVLLTLIKYNPENDAEKCFKSIEKFIDNKFDALLLINNQIEILLDNNEDVFTILKDYGYSEKHYKYSNIIKFNDEFHILSDINSTLADYSLLDEYYFRLHLINIIMKKYSIACYSQYGMPNKLIKLEEAIDGIVAIEIYDEFIIFNFTNTSTNKVYIDKYIKTNDNTYVNENYGSIIIFEDHIKEIPINFNPRYSNILYKINFTNKFN